MAHSVEQRLRAQLSAFVEFSKRAMGDCDLDGLMAEACIRARGGLAMSHAKLLQYLPQKDMLCLRQGVGWKPGVVGNYEVSASVTTPIGKAFALSKPVAVDDYEAQEEWPYPQILRDHGCVSSINVPVRTEASTFGVLEVDHIEPRSFTPDDVNFLLGLANTVAQGIRLKRAGSDIQESLLRERLLHRELTHRVKNNLGLVSAVLAMRAKQVANGEVKEELFAAVRRINSLAVVHDQLQYSDDVQGADAAAHFESLARSLRPLLPDGVELRTECSGLVQGRDLEGLTLIANELITNAAKYAFLGRAEGHIILSYRTSVAGWRLRVRDDGVGKKESLSEGSFGGFLVTTLAARLAADLNYTIDGGTVVDITRGA